MLYIVKYTQITIGHNTSLFPNPPQRPKYFSVYPFLITWNHIVIRTNHMATRPTKSQTHNTQQCQVDPQQASIPDSFKLKQVGSVIMQNMSGYIKFRSRGQFYGNVFGKKEHSTTLKNNITKTCYISFYLVS